MSRSLEQILLSLMPAQASPLPPALVELASSLLAHSRLKAGLKAEEEIGRAYACAHIACDRLKTSLDLPPIDPRPPIAPRVYKRLRDYIDRAVPTSSLTSTPRKPHDDAGRGLPGTRARLPAPRGTPTKETALAPFRTPTRNAAGAAAAAAARRATPTTVNNRGTHLSEADAGLLPLWIPPTIRFLCAETDRRALVPAVIAAAEAVITPAGRRTADEWILAHLAPVTAALYLFAVVHAAKIESGKFVSQRLRAALRLGIVRLLDRVPREVTVREAGAEDPWLGFGPVTASELAKAEQEATPRRWLEGDWTSIVQDVVASASGREEVGDSDPDADGVDDYEAESEGQNEDEDGRGRTPRHARRADTMLQDKYDYLSRDRLHEYSVWKTATLHQIEQLEKENKKQRPGGAAATDVDVDGYMHQGGTPRASASSMT